MDTRLIERLLHDAEALAREAAALLSEVGKGPRRRTLGGLADTAAGTRITLMLMDAVAWLGDRRHGQATGPVDRSGSAAIPSPVDTDVEPRLADLLGRVEALHDRLRRLAGQRDSDAELLAACERINVGPVPGPLIGAERS